MSQNKQEIRERVKKLSEYFSSTLGVGVTGNEDDEVFDEYQQQWGSNDMEIENVIFSSRVSLELPVEDLLLDDGALLQKFLDRIQAVKKMRSEAAKEVGKWTAANKTVQKKVVLTNIWNDKEGKELPVSLLEIPPPDGLGVTVNGEIIDASNNEEWKKVYTGFPQLKLELELKE